MGPLTARVGSHIGGRQNLTATLVYAHLEESLTGVRRRQFWVYLSRPVGRSTGHGLCPGRPAPTPMPTPCLFVTLGVSFLFPPWSLARNGPCCSALVSVTPNDTCQILCSLCGSPSHSAVQGEPACSHGFPEESRKPGTKGCVSDCTGYGQG